MKRKLFLLIGLIVSSISVQSQEYLEMIEANTFTVQEVVNNAETYFADKDKGRGSGYVQFKRWEYKSTRLMNEEGRLPSVTETLAEVENFNAYLNETSETRQSSTDNWVDLGPDRINQTTSWSPGVGRITGISIDPSNSSHIIIGANTGGVWRTIDGGVNWSPLSDYFSNLSVYSVTIDPQDSDTYYFGSTSGLIYKSVDAGATWTQFADLSNTVVNKILIHPTDSNIMYTSNQNAGMYMTTDGGVTWSSPISDNKCYDIEFKPGDPNTVYVSGYGVHKSTNGGASFTAISGFVNQPKMMGVSEDDPTVVYIVEANNGSFGAFYVSDNSGNSFSELDHTGRNYFGYDTNGFNSGGQAPRDMDVAVNPTNVNEVHIAGVLTWRSMDGGVTFENTSDWIPQDAAAANKGYCHADVDLLVFEGTTMFVATDGGIFKAENTGTLNSDYYEDITDGLGIRQLYKIGVSQTENVVVSGGSQDNGTSLYTEAEGWKDWIGADGMESFIDKDNPDKLYGTSQFGQLYRTNNAGNSLIQLQEPGAGQGNWVTPWEQDPTELNTNYLGYTRVYKTVNSGSSWTPISQFFGANLDQMKVAPSDNQTIYVSRAGLLYRTQNGGATDWAQLTSPGGTINSIAIHPTNPNKIAVATTSANKVFVSNDGGTSWQNYKFNLPGFSALALVWDDNDEDALYLGMNYGLFYIDNTFTEWQPYNNNLPNVIISELEINSADGKIYAGTYGRGVWASPKGNPSLNTESFITQSDVVLYPNPANNTITLNFKKSLTTDIRVFDLLGKLVIYQPSVLISKEHTIDVSKLNNGVYFIRINSDEGAITKKLIKE